MKRSFVITPQAKSDLKELLLTIAADNPEKAERLRSALDAALQNLGRKPGIGHYHEELMSRNIRFWNFYSYVIAYVWEARPIQVIAVVHGARDLSVFFSLRDYPGNR